MSYAVVLLGPQNCLKALKLIFNNELAHSRIGKKIELLVVVARVALSWELLEAPAELGPLEPTDRNGA